MNTSFRCNVSILLLAVALGCDIKVNPGETDGASSGDGTTGGSTSAGMSGTSGPDQPSDPPNNSATSTMGAPTSTVDETDSHGETTGVATTGDHATSAGTTAEFPDTEGPATMSTDTHDPVEPRPCDSEVPIDAEILAYTESQIPEDPDTAGTSGEPFDPTLLYVRFSDLPFTCADPHARLMCGKHWELSLRIPTASQTPGLYALQFGEGVHGFGLENGIDLGGDECDGGGSGAQGTLEILAVDADKVVGRLCHVTWSGLDQNFELEGQFIAPRCPG